MANYSQRMSVKALTKLSSLIALSVVLKVYLSLTDGPNWRFTLYGIPLVIVGLLYRPTEAIIAGFAVDFIYVLLSPFAFTFNLMTLSAISFALIPSVIVLLKGRENIKASDIVTAVVLGNMFAFVFNTTQLYIWGGSGVFAFVPLRLGFMIANMILGAYVTNILYARVINPELVYRK